MFERQSNVMSSYSFPMLFCFWSLIFNECTCLFFVNEIWMYLSSQHGIRNLGLYQAVKYINNFINSIILLSGYLMSKLMHQSL